MSEATKTTRASSSFVQRGLSRVFTFLLFVTFAVACGGGGECGIVSECPKPNALVSIAVAPANGTVSVGGTLPLVVTPVKAADSVSVTYDFASTAPSVATVNRTTGVVTGVAPGTVSINISATGSGNGFKTTVQTTVASIKVIQDALLSVSVVPTTASISVGQALTLTPSTVAAGSGVTVSYSYSSSAPDVASVNSTTGAVTGVSPGSTTITLSATGGGALYNTSTRTAAATVTVMRNALASVSIAPSSGSIGVGQLLLLTSMPIANGSGVTVVNQFASNAPAIATVNPLTGAVVGVAPGTATITLNAIGSGQGFTSNSQTATASVTVTQDALLGLSVSPSNTIMRVGQLQSLSPTPVTGGAGVTVSYAYSSDAPSVASVGNQTGVVSALAPGSATITVSATGSGGG